MPDVSSNVLVVYAGVAVAILLIVSTAFPKVLGPISKGMSEWAASRRRRAADADDFRFTDANDERDAAVAALRAARQENTTVRASWATEVAAVRAALARMTAWAWAAHSELLRRGDGAPYPEPPREDEQDARP